MALERIKKKKVLVIGDTLLDETYFCKLIGMSLETPTIKTQEQRKELEEGGAYNVAKNITHLGAECVFITAIGNDEYSENLLNGGSSNVKVVPVNYDGKNIVKKRFWIENGGTRYKYLQVNKGSTKELQNLETDALVLQAIEPYSSFDVIVICDYRQGLITKDLCKKIIQSHPNIEIIGSSQCSGNNSNHIWFKGADLVCMNSKEFSLFCETENITEKQSTSHLESKICVTEGKKGSTLYETTKVEIKSDSFSVNEVDACGAGDCFLAMMAVTNGQTFSERMRMSNFYASLAVKAYGTRVPDLNEVYENVEI